MKILISNKVLYLFISFVLLLNSSHLYKNRRCDSPKSLFGHVIKPCQGKFVEIAHFIQPV